VLILLFTPIPTSNYVVEVDVCKAFVEITIAALHELLSPPRQITHIS
jgi:hypothetical protein